jgi:hypothetical protein
MKRFHIFIIRTILGVVFAVILIRFFHPEAGSVYIAGLALFLIGMSYVTEYLRNRKSKE